MTAEQPYSTNNTGMPNMLTDNELLQHYYVCNTKQEETGKELNSAIMKLEELLNTLQEKISILDNPSKQQLHQLTQAVTNMAPSVHAIGACTAQQQAVILKFSNLTELCISRIGELSQSLSGLHKSFNELRQSSNELHQSLNELHQSLNELHQSLNEPLEVLALHQSCVATRDKLLRQVAGDRKHIWKKLSLIKSIHRLDSMLSLRGHGVSDDDLSYFANRWANLRKKLGIEVDSMTLQGFIDIFTAEGNRVAHERFTFTPDELKEFAKKVDDDADEAYACIIGIGEQLSIIRGESLYSCDREKYVPIS
ncbi:hypothetical protein AMATHDRAFT_42853 [Amanita thiersii Skay4041]|uniref:Uncharacterized protein n=1 Tax=Amanita thiersii Skay4041 TaxID=703135 RepID=A0A2A9NIS3_9AGAR|nr:hypothetical protein AMATHDRAFT_42853 [Amanita thiersii Skay4041]